MHQTNIIVAILFLFLSLSHTANATSPLNNKTPKQKPKIIALSPHIVEMLFELGAGDQIIGTTDYADYPKAALNIERIGNAVKLKLEKIVALKPDLIIAWHSGNPSQDLDTLRKLGFNIMYSQPNTFIELAEEFKTFGEITGHKVQGKTIADAMLNQLSTLRQKYKNKRSVRVFYEVWHQPLTTVARNAWPQRHLDICQAKNPFVNALLDYPQVSIEAILDKNIQAIIQPSSPHNQHRESFSWSNYSHILAVKNNLFIQPNADALHRMTSRSLDEVARLCIEIDRIRSFYYTND